MESFAIVMSPLKGFMTPSQGILVEHEELSNKRAYGFDPNAYNLLATVGYGRENTIKLITKDIKQDT